MPSQLFGHIAQQGFVVERLDETVSQWSETLGVTPWVIIRNIVFEGHFCGQPTEVRLNIALAYDGEQQIELIEQINDAPSPYTLNGKPRLGANHIAYFFEGDFDSAQQLASDRGLELQYAVTSNLDKRYHYYSMPGLENGFIEFVEVDENSKALFELLKSASGQESKGRILQEYSF